MTTRRFLLFAAAALALFLLGRLSVDGGAPAPAPAEGPTAEADEPARPTTWTCPMHPRIRLPDPGDCPICGMDLVPLAEAGAEGEESARLVLSPAARELASIETEPARRRAVERTVRMVGKVAFDETAVRTISAWVAGRLDRLFVDYTGLRVEAGDHMVWLYSPELLTAQEELLSARERLAGSGEEPSEFLAESTRRTYEAAREKLLLWGLTEAQVDEVEARGTAEDHVMITAPSSGVVIEKLVDEGAFVDMGTPIYRLADLGHLWVLLDAYEKDLPWLRYGQDVVIEVEALPGETLEGRIVYIDPFVDERTRTARVRVNVENTRGRLKPGAFVRAAALARLGAGGLVLDTSLTGKWVSPMHPEVVKDGPGSCDVCGMDLVPAEELGLVPDAGEAPGLPLVVPASGVLVTGKRAVVYVEVPGAERPTYEGREVVLGPRAGDEYVVLGGLEEGERVVVRGAFRVDSAMQIRARPSMMSVRPDAPALEGPQTLLLRRALAPALDAYLAGQDALADDDGDAARAALRRLEAAAGPVEGLGASAEEVWAEARRELGIAGAEADAAGDLEALRAAFERASKALLPVVERLGHDRAGALVEAWCPMAFDGRGAAWLQPEGALRNPYFGESMLRCGEVRATRAPGEEAR